MFECDELYDGFAYKSKTADNFYVNLQIKYTINWSNIRKTSTYFLFIQISYNLLEFFQWFLCVFETSYLICNDIYGAMFEHHVWNTFMVLFVEESEALGKKILAVFFTENSYYSNTVYCFSSEYEKIGSLWEQNVTSSQEIDTYGIPLGMWLENSPYLTF